MAHPDDPTAKRLTPKGRTTRDRIVLAAAELIVSHGLRALNMDRVRQAASVSGSQLAHYFTGKSSLIRAVVTRQVGVVLDFHQQPQLGGLNSFDDFERWVDLNMRYLRRVGNTGTPTYHALAAQLAKSDDATREAVATGYWQWIALLEAAIRQMVDNGSIAADADPRRIATVIVCAHQGGATLAYTYRAQWPLADAIAFAVNYLRTFATDPAERLPRRRPRARRPRTRAS
ncbi:TetR/AcrR family transcriptional regulator [Mycobacterium angelicum]|uniref:TetR/AcrR family transcriptional regulator n=1 Tax=Mycobacterium angelicum TaxID=470074 RepID=UPI001FE62B92|nr:helix-turn-helix domain-containing protein [Mycobacterium angelicum]MCV7197972.1 TetR/AcrR family transcriptional regulator [Mycobacterium angelicum]